MKLKIVGKTEDGKLVISNVFKIFDTYGLPLEDIFILCNKDNLVIS